MDLFDHELRKVREHVFPILRTTQHPGVDVADHRGLAQVEANHLGDVGIDRFVVGDAGTDGVRDRDMAGAVGGQQSRYPQHRVGPEYQRVQKIIVDAPINDIDALRTLSGAHVHRFVAHE